MEKESKKPVTAIIVGAGHRSMIYGGYSLKHPDELKIVGVAEPDEIARNICKEKFNIPDNMCFGSAEELAEHDRLADAVINGTMDKYHVPTSVPLLKKGYDMLLEKPFACSETELELLENTVKKYRNKVMICHVLRYSVFYKKIHDIISSGKIGSIISINTIEDVSYHHYVTSYVRGKWRNSDECGTSMLLAKCCHDIDLMIWMTGVDVKPLSVSSYGSNIYYNRNNAPKNSGERCMVDCPLNKTCPLSCEKIYLEIPFKWDWYVWQDMMDAPQEEKLNYLKYKSPYGRCAFKCDNNVVDHQSLIVNFSTGALGIHTLNTNTAYSKRIIRIIGTKGQIEGEFENQRIKLSVIDPTKESDHLEENFDLSDVASAFKNHGGGDVLLVSDFVKYIRGEEVSSSCTSLEDSLSGHRVIFAADKSMKLGGAAVNII